MRCIEEVLWDVPDTAYWVTWDLLGTVERGCL